MAKKLKVVVKLAWWFTYCYIPMLKVAVYTKTLITGKKAEVNKERLGYWFRKAAVTKYIAFDKAAVTKHIDVKEKKDESKKD